MALDWKEILGDTREKYSLYLCSREWSELKRAVHCRAHGICERCHLNPIGAVHHLTYARKYAELLDDLAGWCEGCHAFTHAKSDEDPSGGYFFEHIGVELGSGVARDSIGRVEKLLTNAESGLTATIVVDGPIAADSPCNIAFEISRPGQPPRQPDGGAALEVDEKIHPLICVQFTLSIYETEKLVAALSKAVSMESLCRLTHTGRTDGR